MFNTILVPTDGSELADKAIKAAVAFAKEKQGKVIGLSVVEPYPYSPLGDSSFLPDPVTYDKGMQELAQQHVRKVAAEADKLGVPCEAVIATSFDPADEIVKAADAHQCDIIFIASHGRRGIDRLMLGSVTQKVLMRSAVPVLVFR